MTTFLWIAALVVAANAIYFLFRASREARRAREQTAPAGRRAPQSKAPGTGTAD